jgi:hypothetical protein
MWLLQIQLIIPVFICFFIDEDLRRGKINQNNKRQKSFLKEKEEGSETEKRNIWVDYF